VVPIYLRGTDTATGTPCTARIYIEVHLVRNFKPGILIGLDAITDYGIQMDIPRGTASIPHQQFEYALETGVSPRSSVFVKVAKATVIPGRCLQKVQVKSAMAEGFDYIFEPFVCWSQGEHLTAQLPVAVLDSRTSVVMF